MTNSTNSSILNQFISLNLTKSYNFTLFQNSLANLTNVNHSYKAVLGMLRNITENNESITRDQSKPDYTGLIAVEDEPSNYLNSINDNDNSANNNHSCQNQISINLPQDGDLEVDDIDVPQDSDSDVDDDVSGPGLPIQG